jgi:two-component system sensor histidine kinase TctE
VAAAVITRQINRAIDAGIDLTIEGDPDVGHIVPGHRTLIFEILSNLIDNGIRYNRRGGTVSVRLQTTASETSIAIVDDGPGIAIEHREAAFDRFVRLGTPGSPEGSGLGLAIVRSAAARLNATVAFGDVSSGTTVIIRFARPTG